MYVRPSNTSYPELKLRKKVILNQYKLMNFQSRLFFTGKFYEIYLFSRHIVVINFVSWL